MHDRRTVPRSELFVFKRRSQKQRPLPRTNELDSIPGEDYFFRSEAKRDKITASRPN